MDDLKGIAILVILLGVLALGGIIAIASGCADSDLMPTDYDSVIVYNEDMTEVLYSNTDGCKIKDIDGRLVVVINSKEEE